jgi:SAM-dependent methyltransferase
MKTAALRTLERFGLLAAAYRGWEWARSIGVSRVASDDGLPLPPPAMILRVSGAADAAWFLHGGKLAAEAIRASLDRAGTSVASLESILDFGCGCGRVVRHWRRLPARVTGSGLDAAAVGWCRRNLPFASFAVNGLRPPLRSPRRSSIWPMRFRC